MPCARCRYMKPEGLLSAIIAVYPPEGSGVERAGALPGERRPATVEGSRLVGCMLHCCTEQICLLQGLHSCCLQLSPTSWRTHQMCGHTVRPGLN